MANSKSSSLCVEGRARQCKLQEGAGLHEMQRRARQWCIVRARPSVLRGELVHVNYKREPVTLK